MARKLSILIVDDEEHLQTNLVAYLEDEGYTLVTAGDGETGLEKVGSRKFDIGIIDILGRQTASIFDGGKWAFRTRAGIGFVQCKPLIVWGD